MALAKAVSHHGRIIQKYSLIQIKNIICTMALITNISHHMPTGFVSSISLFFGKYNCKID